MGGRGGERGGGVGRGEGRGVEGASKFSGSSRYSVSFSSLQMGGGGRVGNTSTHTDRSQNVRTCTG